MPEGASPEASRRREGPAHRNSPHFTTTPPTPSRKPIRMCVRCDRITDKPVVISEIHAATGPGFNVYSCPTCAPHFPPVPDALDLLPSQRGSQEGSQ